MANKLVLELIADARNLIKNIEDSSKHIDTFIKGAEKSGSTVASFGKAAGIALAGLATATVAAGAALFAMTKSAANVGDEMHKASQKLGISTEELSTLRFAADLADVSMEEFTAGMKKLAAAQQNASTGNKEALATFRELGVNFRFVDGTLRPMQDVLLETADRFAGMTDATQRAALAQEVFGKGGLALIPLLSQGSAKIREQQQAARDLGLEWSGNDAKAAEAFNDSLKTLHESLGGFTKSIATALIPKLTEVANGMVAWIKANREWITQDIVSWVQRLVEVADRLGPIFRVANTAFSNFVETLVAGLDIAKIAVDALAQKWAIVKRLFTEGNQFSILAWQNAMKEFDAVNAVTDARMQTFGIIASQNNVIQESIPHLRVQTAEITAQKEVYDDIGRSISRIGPAVKLQQAHLKNMQGLEKMGLLEIQEVRTQAFKVAELEYMRDVDLLRDALTQKKITQRDYETEVRTLSLETHAKQMQAVQAMPGFWQTQLDAIVQSNAFAMGAIVNQGTGAFAAWVVQGTSFKQFFISLQTTLVQAVANFGVQKLALLASQAIAETTMTATTEAAKVATTVAGNTAVMASNTATAATTTTVWGGASAAILGMFGAVATGFKVLALSMLAAIKAVGAFVMGVLSAIAGALKATIFGIPLGIAILAGVVAIGIALAATGNIPGLAQGGVVNSPTVAQIGESGPEAVIPLNDRGAAFMRETMGGGGGGQTIIVQIDGHAIAKAVVPKMQNVVKLRLGYT